MRRQQPQRPPARALSIAAPAAVSVGAWIAFTAAVSLVVVALASALR